MNESILTTTDLTKKFGKTIALDNCTMTIKKGQIYGLIGENGAGKTTLMKLICGQHLKDKGTISLFGNITNIEESRIRIGCMIETPVFYPDLSAIDNLKIYMIKKGIPNNNDSLELLKLVGLSKSKNKKFKEFSLGMKQRLGIAVSLIGYPEFLILDEPLNGLDPVGISEIRDLIIKLNQEYGTTFLISSHLLKELEAVATNYGFIHKGKLIKEISNEELENISNNIIKIQVGNTEKASIILENILKNKDYRILADNYINIYNHPNDSTKIIKEFVLNNVDVISCTTYGNDLEHFFLELVGGDIDD